MLTEEIAGGGGVEGARECFSLEMLFLHGDSSVEGHLKSFS